jgi:Cu/Ag efflux pump CusA
MGGRVVGIGGLLISVVLSLIVTPAMYYHLTAKGERAKVEEPQATV